MNTSPVSDDSPIEARDITKSFGQTQALRGASVAVRQGEILAIMGPSGSGKSTLLHCLAGIFPPDSGEVWFDGRASTPSMKPNEPGFAAPRSVSSSSSVSWCPS